MSVIVYKKFDLRKVPKDMIPQKWVIALNDQEKLIQAREDLSEDQKYDLIFESMYNRFMSFKLEYVDDETL